MSDLVSSQSVGDDEPSPSTDRLDQGLGAIHLGSYEDRAVPRFRFAGAVRLGSLLLAVTVSAVLVRWVRDVRALRSEDISAWWMWIQIGLVVFGFVSAALMVGFLLRFAATGRLSSREVWVRSDLIARLGSGATAALVAAGTVAWAVRARRLFIDGASEWYRWTQLVLAVGGIAIACVAIGYFARIALTGRTWRLWRQVAMAFGIVSAAWTLLFLLFS